MNWYFGPIGMRPIVGKPIVTNSIGADKLQHCVFGQLVKHLRPFSWEVTDTLVDFWQIIHSFKFTVGISL